MVTPPMQRICRWCIQICAWPGEILALLVIPLTLMVLATVAAASLGWNVFASWDRPLPLVGRAATVNLLFDLQWAILALIGLFGGALAFRDDRHVAVDFLSAGFSDRTRAVIQLLGDVFFLLPFCAVMIWFGAKFAAVSFASGERSVSNGLGDIWIIKACIPLGFGLLALAGLARILATASRLLARDGLRAPGGDA